MPSHPNHRDVDPLGLSQDVEGRDGPLSDWKLIAGLNLPYEQIIKRFGTPPKAALPFFAGRTAVAARISLRSKARSGAKTTKPSHRQRHLSLNG